MKLKEDDFAFANQENNNPINYNVLCIQKCKTKKEAKQLKQQILNNQKIVERLEKWSKKLQIKPNNELRDFNQLVNNWMGEILQNLLDGKK